MPFHEIIRPIVHSRTLAHVGTLALAMGLYALLPLVKEYSSLRHYGDIPADIHTALSLVLGCLLVFRTNAAYARWWEARTLWGSLINCSRNLSLKLFQFARPTSADRELLCRWISAFPHALSAHLRNVPFDHEIENVTQKGKHVPFAISHLLYEWVASKKRSGELDGDELRVIDVEMAKLMDICGACERIARTPIVESYRFFARQCIFLFLFTLPWALVQDFLWWTIPLTIVVSYFMIGLEIVAEHVEEPFGYDEDDLDLEGMSDIIGQSANQVFLNQSC
jgi:ion channel-forming bestrophin family protein